MKWDQISGGTSYTPGLISVMVVSLSVVVTRMKVNWSLLVARPSCHCVCEAVRAATGATVLPRR